MVEENETKAFQFIYLLTNNGKRHIDLFGPGADASAASSKTSTARTGAGIICKRVDICSDAYSLYFLRIGGRGKQERGDHNVTTDDCSSMQCGERAKFNGQIIIVPYN